MTTTQFAPVGRAGTAVPNTGRDGFRVARESTPHLVGKSRYGDSAPKGARKGMCVGKDNTCKARPVKGTDLCYGHSRAVKQVDDEQG